MRLGLFDMDLKTLMLKIKWVIGKEKEISLKYLQ